MTAMDLKTMRGQFERGLLQEAIIAPAPLEADTWLFLVVNRNGRQDCMTIARTSTPKLYKSVDGAVSDAVRVGFRTVQVQAQQGAVA